MQSIREIYKIGFGPSSSHTMGPSRAAEIFLSNNPSAKYYKVTFYGSLAATGKGHLTDVAVINVFNQNNKEIEVIWEPETFLDFHPNAMQFEAFDENKELINKWLVYSVGGGEITDKEIEEKDTIYGLRNMADILDWCSNEGKTLWEYVEFIEGKEIWDYLKKIWLVMKASIDKGLDNEGVLPGDLKLARKASSYHEKSRNYIGSQKNLGLIFAYALAVAEENAAGGKIVTAPTCGSLGVLPAILFFLKDHNKLSENKILRGLATAGLIANIVKTNGSISGAEVGCQGEIGTACAMAAGATAQIFGGSPQQIEYAAEMGIEHNLGLTCDPVGGYVQIPCIERNAFAAVKAWECSVYALLSDGSHKITFDNVVATMMETGKDLQSKYKETSLGGLARVYRPKLR